MRSGKHLGTLGLQSLVRGPRLGTLSPRISTFLGALMSYVFYKILHFSGLFLMILSLGAIASHRLQGGTKENFKNRKFFSMFHGIGLLVSFVAGFGLMAKGQFSFASGWPYVKMLCWLAAGMYPVIFYKQKEPTKLPYFGLLAVLLVAILTVEYKPF